MFGFASGATRMPTRFCLIRHGETAWNAEHRIQGQIDIELNATGEAQAWAVREALEGISIDAAYSSDLGRAWQTAQIAIAGRGIAVSPAPTFRERHYGVLQGLTLAEASLKQPEAVRHHRTRTPDFAFETGESIKAFAERVTKALAVLADRHGDATVVVFTHGGLLDVVFRIANGRDLSSPRDFPIPNAGLNWFDYESAKITILDWADRRHLDRALDELVE